MADRENLKVKASATGVEVETTGAAAGRLAHALADLISPFSEGMGAAGDSIRRYRIHREESLIAALQRAREIRDRENLPQRHVSTKLLSQWVEGASSEDSSKENITEIWARILASAPENFDAVFAAYMDVCSQIGAREAKIISMLHSAAPTGTGWSIPSGAREQNRKNMESALDSLKVDMKEDLINHEEISNKLLPKELLIYGTVLCFTAQYGFGGYYYVYPNKTEIFITIDLLERLRIVEVQRCSSVSKEGLFIQYAQLTHFGFSFAERCIQSHGSDHEESDNVPSTGEG